MPKPIPKTPLWRGPDVDGITQSLLGKFLECRERFRLKVVEGLAEDEGFSRPLEFGNLWHTAEEAYLGGKDWEAAVKKYRILLERRHPNDYAEILKWYKVCVVTFPIYLNYWKKHKDEANAKPVLEETSFAVPYTLPSGRLVLLRGKWDALRLLQIGKSKKLGIFIKEHKTKGEIDEDGILKTVGWNLQTMLYQVALRTLLSTHKHEHNFYPGMDSVRQLCGNYPPGGVHYNVIRRPLADFHAIKQRKTESLDQFIARLAKDPDDPKKGIIPNAKDYFMRWKVEVTDEDIQQFKDRTLHPILEQLWDWWEWVRHKPFDPWAPRPNEKLMDNPIAGKSCPHFQAPWGVYNSLAGGFRGSFFEYLTSGRDYGLTKVTTLFPELT